MLNLDNREKIMKKALSPMASEYDYILIGLFAFVGADYHQCLDRGRFGHYSGAMRVFRTGRNQQTAEYHTDYQDEAESFA